MELLANSPISADALKGGVFEFNLSQIRSCVVGFPSFLTTENEMLSI